MMANFRPINPLNETEYLYNAVRFFWDRQWLDFSGSVTMWAGDAIRIMFGVSIII